MNFSTWVIGAIYKDLTLFNISSYRTSNFFKDCFFQTDFLILLYKLQFFQLVQENGLRNAILWIIVLVVQGQNDVPVIAVQGDAMYSLGAWSRDVQVVYLLDFLVKTSLDCLFPNWKRTRDSISDLVFIRGKGTHYKPKVGGWVSVSGCGVAAYGMNS